MFSIKDFFIFREMKNNQSTGGGGGGGSGVVRWTMQISNISERQNFLTSRM